MAHSLPDTSYSSTGSRCSPCVGVSRTWFGSEYIPIDLTTIADINANGAKDLTMLGCRSAAHWARSSRAARRRAR